MQRCQKVCSIIFRALVSRMLATKVVVVPANQYIAWVPTGAEPNYCGWGTPNDTYKIKFLVFAVQQFTADVA